MTVLEAVQTNSRRKTLIALRDCLAKTIDSTESGRDIAALSKRLMEVEKEIDGLPKEDTNSPLDKARTRRSKR